MKEPQKKWQHHVKKDGILKEEYQYLLVLNGSANFSHNIGTRLARALYWQLVGNVDS